MMMHTLWFLLLQYVLFFVPFISLLVKCGSKKKFETDARVELVPRKSAQTSPAKSGSTMTRPSALTPPKHTPVEKSCRKEEDTLANVQSLQPESSDCEKNKKKKSAEKTK